jgi:hypothetical protein
MLTEKDKEQCKEEFEKDSTKYFKYLNSFEGLTNIDKCDHEVEDTFKFEINDPQIRKKLPVMLLIFGNRPICEDAHSILMYYI